MNTKPSKPGKKPILTSQEQFADDPLLKLINEMETVDTKSKESKLNEVSNNDNNGKRYWYRIFDHLKPDKPKR